MSTQPHCPTIVLIAATTFLSGAVILEGPSVVRADQESRERARLHLKDVYPMVSFYERGSRITRVYGAPLGGGSTPAETAECFLWEHAGVFGVVPADLDPRSPLFDERHTQPMMYDKETGKNKFTLVLYTQRKGGIPVYGADVRLLIRNEPGYPLVLVSSSLRDLGAFTPESTHRPRGTPWMGAAQLDIPLSLRGRVPWSGRREVGPLQSLLRCCDRQKGACGARRPAQRSGRCETVGECSPHGSNTVFGSAPLELRTWRSE